MFRTPLTTNQILDGFAEGNVGDGLLELLGNQCPHNVERLDGSVGDLGSRAGAGGWCGGGDGGSSGGSSSRGGTRGARLGGGLGLLLDGVDIIVDLLGVLVVAEDLALNRLGGVVGLVLGSQSALGHHAERLCGADLDDALGHLLSEEDILGLDPPHGRGELVCEELDEERVGELLLDLGAHACGGGWNWGFGGGQSRNGECPTECVVGRQGGGVSSVVAIRDARLELGSRGGWCFGIR